MLTSLHETGWACGERRWWHIHRASLYVLLRLGLLQARSQIISAFTNSGIELTLTNLDLSVPVEMILGPGTIVAARCFSQLILTFLAISLIWVILVEILRHCKEL